MHCPQNISRCTVLRIYHDALSSEYITMHCPQNISRCTVLRISNSQVTNLITYRVYQESHYLWISLASYGISRLLQNYDFHYQIQRNMELDPVLSQLKPVVTVTACCFKVCLCNTIPPFRFPPPPKKEDTLTSVLPINPTFPLMIFSYFITPMLFMKIK